MCGAVNTCASKNEGLFLTGRPFFVPAYHLSTLFLKARACIYTFDVNAVELNVWCALLLIRVSKDVRCKSGHYRCYYFKIRLSIKRKMYLSLGITNLRNHAYGTKSILKKTGKSSSMQIQMSLTMTVFFYNENRTFRKYYHKGIRDIKLREREFIFTSHDSTKNYTLKYYLGRSLQVLKE